MGGREAAEGCARQAYPQQMPEGDTIHRATASLGRALIGCEVIRFDAPGSTGPRPPTGSRITAVEARGKHVLIRFSGGMVLHTHMRMTGSWHLYPKDATVPRSRGPVRARIETSDRVAVCFAAPVVELLGERALARHPVLSALGPDLTAAAPDLDEALARVARLPADTPVGVALLDQRTASGVGNVYRSEVLWACGLDPFRPVGALDADTVRGLLITAHDLLRRNQQAVRRTTVPQGLAVYRRAGRPCRRCSTPIRARRLGEQARTCWWCPSCQTGP